MKKLGLFFTGVLLLASVRPAAAQTYVKLNGLYAAVGVLNPAVEFRLSPKSTFQTELVYSPWKSVTIGGATGPMKFGIFLNEYRRYFKERNRGWYVGANAGMMLFNMAKLVFESGKLTLERKSSKGYGMMFGICGGYEWKFRERWLLDVFFGWSVMSSFYNGYALVDGLVDGGQTYNKGQIIMTPHGHENYKYEDPWNGSAEWLPNKIGVSIGLVIFDPEKRRNRIPKRPACEDAGAVRLVGK